MSHTVTVQTQVKSVESLRDTCKRLQLPAPMQGRHRLFDGEYEGYGVQLRGWRYPLVCDVASGEVRADHFGGRWGAERELGKFRQAYAVCAAKRAARKQGYRVREKQLADGKIQLVVTT